jgi:hypothetical protein
MDFVHPQSTKVCFFQHRVRSERQMGGSLDFGEAGWTWMGSNSNKQGSIDHNRPRAGAGFSLKQSKNCAMRVVSVIFGYFWCWYPKVRRW